MRINKDHKQILHPRQLTTLHVNKHMKHKSEQSNLLEESIR